MFKPVWLVGLLACAVPAVCAGADSVDETVGFRIFPNYLQISMGQQHIADYVWEDAQIARPYFKNLRTPMGRQVTRNHPPVKGQDIDDHPTMHPGLWLAFGDVNGVDFWRNKGRVRHVEFIHQPASQQLAGGFTVRNAYEHEGKTICYETCRISIVPHPLGYLLRWESTFRSDDAAFTMGDQEEMGLGVRVATPLAVVKGGQITDSAGRKNGSQVWGQQADWCEYSGVADGRRIGIVLRPDPANFRPSWFHARDYGLLVANPFGRKAFMRGAESQVRVQAATDFRLQFDVLVYSAPLESGGERLDLPAILRELRK